MDGYSTVFGMELGLCIFVLGYTSAPLWIKQNKVCTFKRTKTKSTRSLTRCAMRRFLTHP